MSAIRGTSDHEKGRTDECGAWWDDPDNQDTGYACDRWKGHPGTHSATVTWPPESADSPGEAVLTDSLLGPANTDRYRTWCPDAYCGCGLPARPEVHRGEAMTPTETRSALTALLDEMRYDGAVSSSTLASMVMQALDRWRAPANTEETP